MIVAVLGMLRVQQSILPCQQMLMVMVSQIPPIFVQQVRLERYIPVEVHQDASLVILMEMGVSARGNYLLSLLASMFISMKMAAATQMLTPATTIIFP